MSSKERTIIHEEIVLVDGDEFIECHFVNCTFSGVGASVNFHDCVFEGETNFENMKTCTLNFNNTCGFRH